MEAFWLSRRRRRPSHPTNDRFRLTAGRLGGETLFVKQEIAVRTAFIFVPTRESRVFLILAGKPP